MRPIIECKKRNKQNRSFGLLYPWGDFSDFLVKSSPGGTAVRKQYFLTFLLSYSCESPKSALLQKKKEITFVPTVPFIATCSYFSPQFPSKIEALIHVSKHTAMSLIN